jgi:hypothetical protein
VRLRITVTGGSWFMTDSMPGDEKYWHNKLKEAYVGKFFIVPVEGRNTFFNPAHIISVTPLS